ncbi:MAG: hypothetical protein IPN36_01225 [Bacteroidetes bacterium]|nr:hypothetical protein [Bacteroidota bacterium]
MNKSFISIVFLLFSFPLIAQQAMVAEKSLLLKTGLFATSYTSVFDNDGERKITPSVLHSGFYVNAEAGIHKHWSVLVNAPLLIYNHVEASSEPGGISTSTSISRPGDMEMGLKFGFSRNDAWSACFALVQSLATGYRDKKTNLNTGFADYYTQAFFNVKYHRSTKWSAQTYMGFTNKNQYFGDEFMAGITLNVLINKNLLIDWNMNGIFPLENASEQPNLYLLGLYHNNRGLLNTGYEITYWLNNKMGVFTSGCIPVKGQYLYSSPTMGLGLKLNFNKS